MFTVIITISKDVQDQAEAQRLMDLVDQKLKDVPDIQITGSSQTGLEPAGT